MADYGYDINDIDTLLLDYIKSQKFTINMEGMDTRLKTILATPEEVYSKKTIPCIAVESGFRITTPYDWLKEPETFQVDTNVDKNFYEVHELTTLYYSYKIGYYVTDPRHSSYVMSQLIKIFPIKTLLSFEKENEKYSILFEREQNMITLDQEYNGVKVYRKDLILNTTLHLGSVYAEEYLKARGVTLEMII